MCIRDRYKDGRGHNQRVLLDGAGSILPAGAPPAELKIERYSQGNLLILGVPDPLF